MRMDGDQATPTAPRQHQKRQENPNHTSPLSLLPEALLANILESVPQQNRLKDASVVCRAWARCANAATTSITCHPSCRYLGPANYKDLQYDDKLTPLSTWLSQHAKQVESMEVRIHGSQKLVLPCANLALLTKLDVSYGKVELQLPDTALASSSSASASPAILPKLCQLQLSACTFTSSAALLRLPPLPTVTNLRLSGMPSIEGQKLDDGRGSAALMLMRCLPQLADLRLFDIRAPELVELVAAIPSSLTALELTCYTVGVSYFPQSTPQLAQLQSLVLEEAAFDPRALGDMSRLVRLEVHCCMFLPPDNQGAAAFMAALCGLQQLEQLAVVNTNLLKARPQDCAALTVSPHLTKLVLRQSEQQLLSAGAVSHMMPPGRQLQLQKLVLTSGYRHGRDRGAPCMSAVELQRLISACPSLHSLDITCALQPGGVDTLLQLPSTCCSLAVGGPCFDDAAAATLIQLTQLTDLSWSSSPVTDAGLDHLTALSCLQRLCLEEDHGLSQALIGYDGYMDEPYELVASSKLRTKTRSPACNAPLKPVWQQLQDLLDENPGNTAWRKRMQQQEDAARREMQQKMADLGSYMQQALAVMAHCAGNSAAVQLVQDMSRIASTALSGRAAAAGGGDASGSDEDVSDEGGGDGVQQQRQRVREYQELHSQLLAATCGDSVASGGSSDVRQALAAMEAIVLTTVQQQE